MRAPAPAVAHEQAVAEEAAGAAEVLERFTSLERAEDADQGAEHAGRAAARTIVRRGRLREDAAQAGALAGKHRQQLPAFSGDPCVDEGPARGDGEVVQEVLRGERIRCVDDEVVGANERLRGGAVAVVDAAGVGVDPGAGGEGTQVCRRDLYLGASEVAVPEQDLPGQVGEVDRVAVDQTEAADAGARQGERRGIAETADADDENSSTADGRRRR